MNMLLAAATIAQKLYSTYLFRRFLSGVILLGALTIASGIMISVVLVTGFCALYLALVHYGIETQSSFFIAGSLLALTTGVLVILTLLCLRTLRDLPHTLLRQLPVTARATETVEAFLDGFLNETA